MFRPNVGPSHGDRSAAEFDWGMTTPHIERASTHESLPKPWLDRILLGDAVEVLQRLPSCIVDLVVTSPPYDDLRHFGGVWTVDALALGRELLRVCKDGAIAAIVIGDASRHHAKSLSSFRWAVNWVDQVGWRLFECCIYQRHGRPGPWFRCRFRVDHEYILLFVKGKRPRRFNKLPLMVPTKHAGKPALYRFRDRDGKMHLNGSGSIASMKCRGTVWPYIASCSDRDRSKLAHPATIPDRLAQDLIKCFSLPGDLVLDPMVGSGTAEIAAKQLGRHYLGVMHRSLRAREIAWIDTHLCGSVNYQRDDVFR
jgi:DNA modification methylase